MRRKILGIIMAIAAISSLFFGLVGCAVSPNKEVTSVNVKDRDGNEENLRRAFTATRSLIAVIRMTACMPDI